MQEVEENTVEGSSALTGAVAQNLFHLMAYKDEYEVARLHSSGDFMAELHDVFDGDFEVTWHMSPPLISREDPATHRPQKRGFGSWMHMAMKLLAPMKGLRGGAFDVFGYSAERRMERDLINEYKSLIEELLTGLQASNHGDAVEIAGLAQGIRGYGPVKLAAVEKVRKQTAERLAAWQQKLVHREAAE